MDTDSNVSEKLNLGLVVLMISGLSLKLTKSEGETCGGHSFRVLRALDLLTKGKSIEQIMIKGGWRTIPSALA